MFIPKRGSEVDHDRKTQIALEYALRMKKANPTVSIFWVHAASIERFRQAFSAIASQCQINEKDDTEADVLPRVKRWMESAKSGKWLMILDNADDLELFCGRPSSPALGSTKDIASRPLKHYLPTCTHGSILITTRNRQVGIRLCDDMPVEVTSMSEEEAQALLRTRLSHKDKASVELSTLARRLDHLPLALSQASAYIQETDITVGRYLELLGDEEELVKMLSRDFEATGRDPETYHAVAHTWFLSFQEIEEQCRLATQVLSLMSLLDRQDIPYTILSHYYFYVRPDDGDPTQSELEEALGILKSFSLVTGTDNGNFDIHRLVQLVTQQWIKGRETKAQFATAALYAMYHLIPKPSQSEILGRNEYVPFVSHAKELFGQVEFFYEDDSEVKADLQLLLGIHLWKDGQWSDAERLVSEVIRYSTSKYGELHITTLACRKLLGMIYHSQGRWNESERILKDVIGSADQTLGKQSYVAQTSSLGLAELYNSQDRFVEASRLLESLMAISISCGGNLPNDEKEVASGHVNRSKRARILRKFVKPLGVLRRSNRFADVVAQDTSRKSSSENKPGNAFVVAVMIDLSSAYLGCGRFLEARLLAAGAFKLFQAPRDIEAAMVLGLENCETTLAHDPKWPVLPEASPRTTALINLGSGDMHSTIAAVVPKVEAGGACIITPMVSQILSNDFDWCKRGAWEVAIASANVCEADGQYLEAYEVNARVLKSQMAMLGARHVSTLWAMQRASRYLRSLLRYAEAETCCKQGLDYVKGAPVSDPIVALRLSAELSFVYAGQNRHIEAFKLMSDLIPSFVEKLGPDHHATLELKGSFGYEHQFAHSVEAGETILLSVLQAFQRLHGADSRWALATSLKLAMLLASSKFSSDQSSEAYDSFVQLLPLYTAKYGETHPETVILTMLAAVAASLEDPSVAVDFATRALDLGITYLETVPELHAAVVFVLYISYTDLGEYEKAIGFGRRACELSTNGAATGRVLALSSLFAELGLWADAADLLEKHLTHLLTTSYKHHGKTWVTMQCLALAFQAVGRLEEAAKLQLDVTEQGQSQLQVDELDSIETSYASTLMLFHKGRPRPEAYSELLFKQAESWCRTVGPYGEETTTGILSLRSEVIDCQESQHTEQAEGTLRKLVELHKNYFDEDHTSTYRGLLDLADFLADQYRLVEAAPFYEELLRILEKHRGAAASWTLMAIRDLGECRVREKRPREAAELFMEEAFRARAAYGAGHFRTLHALSLFAEQLLRLGCWYQLKQLQLRLRNCPDLAALADSRALKHSKANSDEKSGTDSDADSDTDIDVDVADQDKEVFEGIFLNLMKLEHSPELHEQILQKVEKASRSKACVVLATCNLAQVLIKRGALAESWRLLDPLLQRPGDSSLGSAHRIALTTANLARCNQQRGHWKEMGDQYVGITQLFDTHMSIEDIFQSVNHLFAGLSTSEHDYSLKPQSKASSVDTELPETGRAYTMAHRAREAAKLVFGADDEITLVIQVSIAHMLYDKAEQGRAIETLKDAAELQKLALGPDYRETQSSMQTLQQWENCAKVDSQSTTLREEFVA